MADTALIVEDEVFVALDIERILDEAGYAVGAIAADMESALTAASGCSFALVDVQLQDGPTGSAIASALTERGIGVVFITANPSQIMCPEALGYVQKPFSQAAILDAAALATGRPGAIRDVAPLESPRRGG